MKGDTRIEKVAQKSQTVVESECVGEKKKQRSERWQTQERFLTSGYGAMEGRGVGVCLLVKKFFLKCNVSVLQSMSVHVSV